jgi:hypothetical protein
MRNPRRIDDIGDFQLGSPRQPCLEQARRPPAAPEPAESSTRRAARPWAPAARRSLPSARRPSRRPPCAPARQHARCRRLRTCTAGRRVARRHRLGRLVRHHEQRRTGQRPSPAPRARDVIPRPASTVVPQTTDDAQTHRRPMSGPGGRTYRSPPATDGYQWGPLARPAGERPATNGERGPPTRSGPRLGAIRFSALLRRWRTRTCR